MRNGRPEKWFSHMKPHALHTHASMHKGQGQHCNFRGAVALRAGFWAWRVKGQRGPCPAEVSLEKENVQGWARVLS